MEKELKMISVYENSHFVARIFSVKCHQGSQIIQIHHGSARLNLDNISRTPRPSDDSIEALSYKVHKRPNCRCDLWSVRFGEKMQFLAHTTLRHWPAY